MKRVKHLFICFIILFAVQAAYSQNTVVQEHNKPVVRKPARQRKHKERDKDRDEDKDRGKDKDKDENKKKFDDDDDRDDDDRPDLAMEQEARLTRDPATGRVERGRLQNVLNIIKQQRANQKAQLQSGSPSPSGTSPSASLANANWVERGPTNVGGRTRAIMFDPNDNTHKKVWAGGVDGGLWVCSDITAATPTWTTINDFWANLAVSTIACSSTPTRSNVFYVGTGEGWFNVDAAQGAGIWKTTDGGVTWNQLASTSTDVNFNYIEKIVVDTAGNVFAATSSQYCNRGGIFESTDGGNTWTLVLGTQGTTCANSNCSGADLQIGADQTIYASLGIFNVGGIYRSENDGTTWTQINTNTNGFPTTGINRIAIGVAPSDPNRLYAMVQKATTDVLLNIYTSDNKGTTWTTCQLPKWSDDPCTPTSKDMTRTQAWYDLIISVDPNNAANVLAGGVDIMKSTNNGTSWTQISSWWGGCGLPYMHADQHAIVFQPGSSSNAVFGNDGGIFYSTNITAASPAFASEDNSYNVTQFYACAMDPTAGKNYFMAGAQDNGTQLFTTAGLNATTDVVGGDGAYCFIDQTNPTYQIGSYTNNNYYLSTNNWASSTQISNATTGDFINPADYDNNNHILYSASSTTKIQRITGINTTPGTPSLFTVTGMAALPGNIRVSPYSPAGTTTLFVGTQDGHLFKVTNAQGAAPTTTNISGTAAPWATTASISCIEIGASENDLVVTFSNYGVVSVWRTTNGGTTWNNAEGNLPDMPIWWVMYNPNDLSQALLGTEIGVWSTDDITVASPNWVVNNNNLANCRVCQLRIRSSDKEVIAATHGRGLFSTDVFAIGPPTASFTASPTEICEGGSVAFTDESSHSPTSWNWTFTGGTPATSTLQNNTVTYSTPGVYPVTLIVSNASGSDTLTKTSYITVDAPPVVSVNSLTFCSGLSGTLTAGGATTYAWQPAAGLSATTGGSVTANPSTTTTYTVTGTNTCGSTTAQAVVNINPAPTLSVSGTTSFCIGGNTSLLESGASTYSWAPATGLNVTTGASVTANPTVTTTYTVTGTSADGCTGTQQITITVNPLPSVSISGTNDICIGGNTNLLASGANTYSWLPATGLNITSGASVSANPTITTTYTVTGTSASGCTGTQQITITVNPLPTISISGNNSICNSGNTALLASGANTYKWLPAAGLNVTSGASVTASPTITTTYTVTGTSASGCTGTQQITITVNPLPTVSISGNNSICGGGNTALLASGANTYTWLPAVGLNVTSGASVTASPTITTTYTVTGTSAGSCTGTQQITITVNPLPSVSISGTNNICIGGNTNLLASGANTYSWLPATGLNITSGASVTANPTITTTYTVTGTSASGCTGSQQVTITINPLPTVSISGNNSICGGGNTALLASGANTYTWLPAVGLNVTSGASVTASPTITTTYTVTGTSAGGCTGTQQITITVNLLPTVSISGNNSICAGGNTALLASGANTYSWLPTAGLNVTSGASVTASPTITTTYTVTGTSAGGCTGTQQITITVNPLPTVSISGNNSICNGGNTALLASGTNTYTWLPASGLNITSGASVTANPTITTTYTVTGTGASGCTGSQQITIIVNPLPTVSISGNNSICGGGNTALLASGANTYTWLPAVGLNVTSGASVTASPTITTTYTVTGTSAGGCTGTQQITITVNLLPTVSISGNNSICAGGNTALLASGANTYSWLPTAGLNVTSGASVTASPTITTTYTVTGTSAGGCTGTQQITITVNPLPTVSISGNNSICNGGNTALLASGTNTYTWLPASGLNITSGASVTANPTITTTYTVTGTGASGCTGTQQITITVNPLPNVSISGNNSICSGGNTALLASGANIYTWLPSTGLNITSGAGVTASPTITTTYTVTGTSVSGCTGSQQITITVNPLPTVSISGNNSICTGGNTNLLASGANTYTWLPSTGLNITSGAGVTASPTITTTYTVTGTSVSGCTGSQQVTITINPLPTVSISGNNSICTGGNTALLASGANTYAWLPATGLNVTSGASVTASPTITTTYTVTGTSVSGCTGTQQITITVNPLPIVSISGNNSICSGGNTALLASGANTYSWLPVTGLNVTTGASVTANPTITTTYTVTGTSAGGCTGTQQITITINPLPPVSISGNSSICGGGNTALLASGADTYTWLPAAGLNVTSGASVTASPIITTTYTVTGTSAGGCTGSQQVTITINPLPTVSISGNNSICTGGNTALLASGANTYAWLPATGLNVTSGASVTASPTITTTYTVTGTSVSGCTGTQQITITVNPLPIVSISGNNSICSGGNTALLASGANTYSWLPVTGLNVTTGASVTANPTITTTYTVTGTSAGGCTGTQQITITVNPLPTVSISGNNSICGGGNTALLASGANTYAWLPAAGLNVTSGASVTASPTITTTYTVTGTSVGGCTGAQQITIIVNPLPTLSISGNNSICAGGNTALLASGANTYSWLPTAGLNITSGASVMASPIITTTYTVTGTSAGGCTGTQQITITVNPIPTVSINGNNSICAGGNMSLLASGANTYAWLPAAGLNVTSGASVIASPTITTTYTVTGTSASGCTGSQQITITVNPLPTVSISGNNSICAGGNAALLASGANTYTWLPAAGLNVTSGASVTASPTTTTTYTVTGTSASGCTGTQQITITVNPLPTVSISGNNSICAGGNTALLASGANTYTWLPATGLNITSGASVTASPTITTTYTITGTSAGGCTGTQQITITLNPLPTVSISGNNSICNGGNTALLASGANTYAWLPAAGLNVTSGASVAASPTITTTYTVTGTSASGCTGSQQITITVNPLPTVSISGNNSICAGSNTALSASGANTYTWLPAAGLNVTSGASVTASPTITTTYTVTGTSASGCTGSQQVTITINPLPTVSISGNNSICGGGNTALLASGANTYTWLPAAGLNVTSGASVTASPTITTTYTVTGTSASGCTGTQQITITVNPLPIVSISGNNSICSGGNTALLASGANTYTWLPATGLNVTSGASVTGSPTITTTYTVTSTSASGCTGSQQITITVNPLPSVSISGNNSICPGGNTALLASGANTYTWLPAAGLNITSGASVTASPTITTTYTVTGTSASGCTGAQQITITVNPLPTVSISGNNSICSGNNTALLASGANTYAWLPATGLNVTSGASVTASPTVTTAYTVAGTNSCGTTTGTFILTVNFPPTVSVNPLSICNGTSGALNATGATTYSWSPAIGLNATTGASVTADPTINTTYIVTGTSICGTTSATSVVTVTPLPSVSVNPLTICNGSSGILNASGAATYSWLPSNGLSATTGATVTANPAINTTYTVTGISSCGTTSATSIVSVNSLPTVSISGNNSICSGGNTALLASGANTYAWLPASGLNVTSGASVTASPTTTTTYTVTGTSASGCTGTQQITITVNPLPTVSISGNNSICAGGNTALLASGANTYTWLPAAGLNVTSGASVTASPTITTTYTVTGTSAGGCTGTQQITITVNLLPTVSISGNNSICGGGNTALLASGADTYTWLPAAGLNVTSGASVTASPIITTTYTVTGTSAGGCTGSQQVTITINPLPTVSISGNNSICTGGNTALLASGANTYAWLPATGLNVTSGASVTASPTITTTYTVTGTSVSGCTGTQQITITVNPLPIISISGNNSICSGGNTSLLASGANTYTWLPAAGLNVTSGASVTASPTTTTTYTVTGTSTSGCTDTQQITITVNPLPAVSVSGNNNICSGGNTALLASGANTYTWLPAAGLNVTSGASVTASPTITTTYTVTGTSAGGCTGTQQITITVNPLPTVSISGNNSICNGGNTALLASGTNIYTWLPASGLNITSGASVTANPTITTTYTVTGTGASGCTGSQQITITVNPLPTVSISGNNSICSGNNTALLASGANTYAWLPATGLNVTSGASVTASPTVTTAYTVAGTNSCGTTTGTFILTVNFPPTVSVNPLSICNGTSGALNATGATTYSWSPAIGLNATTGASVTADPTINTTYIVTGTSICGTTSATSVVTVTPLPSVSVNPLTICNGSSGILNASGAATYSWLPSNGLSATTGATVTANPAINTTYTVTGISSCGTTSATSIVSVNSLPTVSISGNNSICSGGNTALLASGANTYAWLPASGLNVTSGASVTASPTTTTTYTVTGTSASGCTGTQQITITVNPLPTVSISGNNSICSGGNTNLLASGSNTYSWLPATGLNITSGASVTASPTITTTYTITGTSAGGCTGTQQITITLNPLPTVSISGNNSICNGGNTALLASGANTYTWLPAAGLNVTSGASVAASPTITTTYTVTGTSASGCTGSQQITITVNPLPTVSISGNNSICAGSNTALSASGANTYTWLPAAGLNVTSGASVTASPTITTTYTVTGTSASGCTGTQQITITVNPLPTVSISGNNSICTGGNTALLASGANTYAWLPATGLNVTSGASVTASPTITTTYTVTGTSASGCTGTQQITITVNPLPTVSISGNNSICTGGNTALLASGANTYAWLPAAGLNVTSGASVTASPTTTTTYTVTGTSTSGCTDTQQITITVNPLPAVSVSGNNNICSGGNTALLASGANTYKWLPATGLNVTSGASVTASPTITTTYTVTGTSAGGCTGAQQITITVNPLPTVSISGNNSICNGGNTSLLVSGGNTYTWLPATGLNITSGASVTASPTITTTYAITGTSASGCTGTQQITITVNPLPTVSISGNNSICSGGNTALLASGANTYKWLPTTGLNVTSGASVTASPTITTTYTVTGTSAGGCTGSQQITITVNPLPTVSISGNNSICAGGNTALLASGANTYTWLPATGLNITSGASVTASPTITTTYTVTGTSASGCTGTQQITITVNPLPIVSISGNNSICTGGNSALLTSGANTYTWLPATGLNVTSGAGVTASPIITTTYTVTGTSAGGCTGSQQITVTVTPLPAISISGTNTICSGSSTSLTVSGASAYTWSPNIGLNVTTGASVTASPTIATTYTVTGTNGNNCSASQQVAITVNPSPIVSIIWTADVCPGKSTTLTGIGANSYTWLPATDLNATTGAIVSASPTNPITYTVTGTDANGCTGTQQAAITINPLPSVSTSGNNTICQGNNTTLTVSGADTYTWLPATGLNVTTGAIVSAGPAVTTTYTVTGTNSCGTTSATFPVIINTAPTVSVNDITICNGSSGTLTASGTNTYTWLPSTAISGTTGTSVTVNPTVTTTYTVTGTGTCGTNTATAIVTVGSLPSLSANTLALCNGTSGTLNASGASNYSWQPTTGLNATTGANVTASPTTTTTYTITGTSTCGTTSVTTVVTVNPIPTVSISGTNTICSGNNTALMASGASTYKWLPAIGLNVTSGANVVANPTISSTYTVTGTNINGCTGAQQITLTIAPLPVVSIGGANSICDGDSASLTAAGAVTYIWSTGETTAGIKVSPTVNATYTLTGTDAHGCMNSDTATITLKSPVLLAVNPQSAVCTGQTSVALSASGAATYTWSPADNLTPSAGTSATETAQISQLTFYTVTGTGANSCTASVVVPVATIVTGGLISPAFSIICSGGTKALSVTGEAGNDYQWQISADNVNWSNITGAANTTYTTASSDGNTNKFYRLMAQSNSCWNVASTTSEVDISSPTITVTTTNITDNSLTLNWNPTGTGNYSISYSGASSGTQTSVTPAKTITGLTADGTYSITVTQTGVTGCPASGAITGVTTLCAMPTGVTLSSPASGQILVSWTGVPGADYRVYYRPLFSYNTYFTQDVSNASSVLLTRQGVNNLYASTTYEVYVSRLDCPNTGNVGQGTNPTNVTTLPTVTCVTPKIDSVRSVCPVQIEVFIHNNGVNQYTVFIQRITPGILAVNSYGVSGTYFTINVPYSGDQYLIALQAKCGSAISSMYVYPGNVTVKPLCTSPNNLVLSNPTCHGFTASWNADECLSNAASQYLIYERVAGTINYNDYGVPLPANGIGPNKLINFLATGETYQVFVRSVYSCNGFVTYGPSSQVQTITTPSNGCRDEDVEQPQENKPATQQYSPDNSEVFSLYPNPNSGKFVVDLSRLNTEEDAVRIEVINMLGQTVLTHVTTISGGHLSEYINLPNGTATGTYIVRLTAGKNVYTAKINVSK